MVAVAIVGSAVVAGGVGMATSSKATKTAQNTAATNNALQKQVYDQNAATLSPYVGTGNKATTAIEGLLGIGGDAAAANKAFDAYKASTEYTSRIKQGQDSVTSSLGARGLLDSGAAQKALLRYGQTFGSNEFGQYLGNLQGQQQVGLGAASAQAGVGTNYANSVSANNNNAANAAITGALGTSNAINGILGNAVSAYGYSQGMGSSYGGSGGLLKSQFEAGRVPAYPLNPRGGY